MNDEAMPRNLREAVVWNEALDAAVRAIEELPKDEWYKATHFIHLLKMVE